MNLLLDLNNVRIKYSKMLNLLHISKYGYLANCLLSFPCFPTWRKVFVRCSCLLEFRLSMLFIYPAPLPANLFRGREFLLTPTSITAEC